MSTPFGLQGAAGAAALFTSPRSSTSRPSRVEALAAIRTAVRAHGGVQGCTIEVAGEYGEHPETAAPRMRWARGVVDALAAQAGEHGSVRTGVAA